MKYIFGNWKMYLDLEESVSLAHDLIDSELNEIFNLIDIDISVFPSTLAFSSVYDILQSSNINIGAQNLVWAPKGAYTGEVSALMFKDAGANYALVGHSERRYIFNETNEIIRKKIDACLDSDLKIVLCVGETQEIRDNNQVIYYLKEQLSVLKNLEINDNLIIAYEPVWSIGTGLACQPFEVESVISLIKQELKLYTHQDVPVLYGGSVNENNILNYWRLKKCSGVLVGGASTKIERFEKLCQQIIS